MQLSQAQLACADAALDPLKRLFAVTGSAGTGKTTIIKYIAEQLSERGISYAVCAPTGKAAKRIKEVTGLPAITVHKLLEYGRPGERDKDTGESADITHPKRDKFTPFDELVILCDEYSMINHELNRNLIDALRPGGRLIMFGDIAQLPPIEKYHIKNADGSPFNEHLKRASCAFMLTEIYRQAEGSDVLTAATAIRKGFPPRRGEKFLMHYTDSPVKKLEQLVMEAEEHGIDYASIDNQILTPMRTRWIGTGPLNVMLRGLLNPHGRDETELTRYSWDEKNPVTVSVGDKVVCTENTYDMRNYTERFMEWQDNGNPVLSSYIPTPDTKYMLNGETGKIIELYPDGGMEIDFGDRVVEVPYAYEEWWEKRGAIIDTFPQRSIELAYALTVHKAQGSEYRNVIYVMNNSVFFMLCRENIYTAVTRARERCEIITDMKSMSLSLKITNDVLRKRRESHEKNKGSLVK